MSTCLVGGYGHHGDDMITVWHGRPTPLRMCGKHYAQLGASAFRVWRDIVAAPESRRLVGYADVITSGEYAGEFTFRTGTGSSAVGNGDWRESAARHGYAIGAPVVFLINGGAGEIYPLYERDWSLAP